MVATRPQLRVICAELGDLEVPWVIDPVTRTSGGEQLSRLTAEDYMGLARPTGVLTPNLPELEWLVGSKDPRRLLALGFGAVICKGGHANGRVATDFLWTSSGMTPFEATRLQRAPRHRGTGCRFASALAAEMAKGRSVSQGVTPAKRYVRSYLESMS
jgi:hydroxymethylpyrimidine/phosphomethylpyrimidine kinase